MKLKIVPHETGEGLSKAIEASEERSLCCSTQWIQRPYFTGVHLMSIKSRPHSQQVRRESVGQSSPANIDGVRFLNAYAAQIVAITELNRLRGLDSGEKMTQRSARQFPSIPRPTERGFTRWHEKLDFQLHR
jgi:hypothetical protein